MKENNTDIITTVSEAITSAETTTAETTAASIQAQVTKTASLFERALEHFKNALPSLVMAVIILLIGIIAARLISGVLKRTLKKSNIDDAARSFLVSLIKIVLYIIVVIMALSLLNVPMSSIITIFGAAGLAVSLALQNCLSNLCGGFIILFSKPFSAGDLVEVNDSLGYVRSISILYTKIETFNGRMIYIPNGKVSDAKIVNYTSTPERRIDITVDIGYDEDFKRARSLIFEALSGNEVFLKYPEPVVRMTAHGESAITLDVKVFVLNENYEGARYDLLELIKEKFDENDIEIPYKQIDVHIR